MVQGFKMMAFAAAGAALLALGGCAGTGSAPQTDAAPADAIAAEAHAAMQKFFPEAGKPNPAGVYEGLLPCGDCQGLRTAIYVEAAGTYKRIYTYEGEKDDAGKTPSFAEGGDWSWKDGHLVFYPKDHSPEWLADPIEGGLRLLDMEGNPVEGELAPMYDLKKN